MSYKERILDYLWSVAPGGATNGQLARALGIPSQQTVYMTTQELAGRRLIRAVKEGATWVFYALDAYPEAVVARSPTVAAAPGGTLQFLVFGNDREVPLTCDLTFQVLLSLHEFLCGTGRI